MMMGELTKCIEVSAVVRGGLYTRRTGKAERYLAHSSPCSRDVETRELGVRYRDYK